MSSIERIIWNTLGINRADTPPCAGINKEKTSRKTLYGIMNKGGLKYGAEIGVDRGRNAATICRMIPRVKLICVDPWTPYRFYSDGTKQPTEEQLELIYEQAKTRLSPYDVTIMRMTSLEASHKIPDESLDFVYIDAMHEFDPVMTDILLWVPKVKHGGIVSGHDFKTDIWWTQVEDAVRAYTKAHRIMFWYLVGFKSRYDKTPSWFWVKK